MKMVRLDRDHYKGGSTMTQPITGRSLMPQSLEVSKIEQLKSVAQQHHQQSLAVQQEKEQRERLERINQSSEAEKKKIRSDDQSKSKKQKPKDKNKQRRMSKKDENNKEDENFADNKRGHIIDIRV